jgi:hypothetical protein
MRKFFNTIQKLFYPDWLCFRQSSMNCFAASWIGTRQEII